MSRQKFLYIVFILFILTSCAGGPEIPTQDKQELATQMINDHVPVTVVPLSTKTHIVSPTITSVPTLSSTASPVPVITETCIEYENKLPKKPPYSGVILLQEQRTFSFSLLNLLTGEVSEINQSGRDPTLSPDKKQFGLLTPDGPQLIRYNSAGKIVNSIYLDEKIGALARWVDDDHILLVNYEQESHGSSYHKYPAPNVLLTLSTGATQTLDTDFEDIDKVVFDVAFPWTTGSTTIFHPNLQRVIYPAIGNNQAGIVLYDIPSNKRLAFIETIWWKNHPPVWSPDGSKFILMGDDEFYLVTYDGIVTKLTKLNPNYDSTKRNKSLDYDAVHYSWSPNNRQVAFWLNPYRTEEDTLSVLDTETGKVTNYCNPIGLSYQDFEGKLPIPQWSPDGKTLVVAANYKIDSGGNKSNDVLIFDLEKNTSYKIAKDSLPVGWLVSP